jgi:hypothetical protein
MMSVHLRFRDSSFGQLFGQRGVIDGASDDGRS